MLDSPFFIVDGRRYVLADGEEMPREPEIFASLAPPPREVSLAARFVLRTQNSVGGIVGWCLAEFGLIACIFLLPTAFKSLDDLSYRDYVSAGEATITSVAATSTHINSVSVYSIKFKRANGEAGECYITGRRPQFDDGAVVPLEECRGRMRLVGTRHTTLGAGGLFFGVSLILPAVGLGLAFAGVRRGSQTIQLLQSGEVAHGRFREMKATATHVNSRPVMLVSLNFDTPDGATHTATARILNTELVTQTGAVPIFYDQLDPSASVVWPSLASGIGFSTAADFARGTPTTTFRASSVSIIISLVVTIPVIVAFAVLVYAISIGGFITL